MPFIEVYIRPIKNESACLISTLFNYNPVRYLTVFKALNSLKISSETLIEFL